MQIEIIIAVFVVLGIAYLVYRWYENSQDDVLPPSREEPAAEPAAVKPIYEQPVRSVASAVYEQPAAPTGDLRAAEPKKRRGKKVEAPAVATAPVVEPKRRRRGKKPE